ncbi:MAG TPA: hypothetical protein VF106_47820, partial [Actinophytocola sp.]
GLDADAFGEVADIIAVALAGDGSAATLAGLGHRVRALAARFPLYPHLSKDPHPTTDTYLAKDHR